MAVTKKDQERANYALMYGAQARKDGKDRDVPGYWEDWRDAWLQGFDGVPLDGGVKAKAVSANMKAEVDEAAVGDPPPGTAIRSRFVPALCNLPQWLGQNLQSNSHRMKSSAFWWQRKRCTRAS
jgi:hypothetical protein